MHKIDWNDSGTQVGALCLGTMYFGTTTDRAASYELLDRYMDAGGNFLDTANCYSFWVEGGHGHESETLLGDWMRTRGNRQQVFLATKTGVAPDLGRAREWPANKEGLSSAAIERAIDSSLRRLQTDHVDLYYTHSPDSETPMEETLEAFNQLVQKGKVRHIGASNLSAWRLEQARALSRSNDWAQYGCVQQRHTYLRPKHGADFEGLQLCVNDDLLDYCIENRTFHLLAYSPLLSGAYTRPDRPLSHQYATPDTEARLATLREVANETAATLNQVVLAWMMQGDLAIIPVISASTPSQLDENLGALQVTLSDEQLQRLTSAGA